VRGERGQTTSEYVGVLLIVSVIVAGVATLGLGTLVAGAVHDAVCAIAQTECANEDAAAPPRARGPDADADGLSDQRERQAGTDPAAADTDGDGVPDGREISQGSDPAQPDSDRDGLNDAEDAVPGTADADGDGLSDGEEVALGSDARKADTDGDGTPDREEYEQGTDPTQAVAPLTWENLLRPWERVGMSEDQWRDLEREILDEANPGGWKGFLIGNPY
jgi:hypothetical protein